MAKVTLNPVIEAVQGKVRDLIFKRWEGQDIVSKMPDRTGIVPMANQLAQMDKFRLAALYGKAVLTDPDSRTFYDGVADRSRLPLRGYLRIAFADSSASLVLAMGEISRTRTKSEAIDEFQTRC